MISIDVCVCRSVFNFIFHFFITTVKSIESELGQSATHIWQDI